MSDRTQTIKVRAPSGGFFKIYRTDEWVSLSNGEGIAADSVLIPLPMVSEVADALAGHVRKKDRRLRAKALRIAARLEQGREVTAPACSTTSDRVAIAKLIRDLAAGLDDDDESSNLTPEEALAAEFALIDAAKFDVEEDIDAHYMPHIRTLIEAGDLEGARTLEKKIPRDSLTWAFAADALRQASREKTVP